MLSVRSVNAHVAQEQRAFDRKVRVCDSYRSEHGFADKYPVCLSLAMRESFKTSRGRLMVYLVAAEVQY